MKKSISFDEICQAGLNLGLDAAISKAFPGCKEVKKGGLIGEPLGTIEVDGVAWDWVLKSNYYVFLLAV